MSRHFKHQAISFRHAINGVFWAFHTQPHFRFHIVVSIFVFILGVVLHISLVEFALLAIVICFVLTLELVNTAIESIVDMATSEWQGYAKVAKDVSAGFVLTASLGSVVVGCIIFLPRIISYIMLY